MSSASPGSCRAMNASSTCRMVARYRTSSANTVSPCALDTASAAARRASSARLRSISATMRPAKIFSSASASVASAIGCRSIATSRPMRRAAAVVERKRGIGVHALGAEDRAGRELGCHAVRHVAERTPDDRRARRSLERIVEVVQRLAVEHGRQRVQLAARLVGEDGDEDGRRLQDVGQLAHQVGEQRRPARMRHGLGRAKHRLRGVAPDGRRGAVYTMVEGSHDGKSMTRRSRAVRNCRADTSRIHVEHKRPQRIRDHGAARKARHEGDTGRAQPAVPARDGHPTTFQGPLMSTVHTFAPRFPPRETVLCLHCSGSSGRQWKSIGAALSARFDVTAPDLLGYGGEQRWPAGTPASLDDEARALAPLLQTGGVHLFGHSYGGAVALQIALRWPERVKSCLRKAPQSVLDALGQTGRSPRRREEARPWMLVSNASIGKSPRCCWRAISRAGRSAFRRRSH